VGLSLARLIATRLDGSIKFGGADQGCQVILTAKVQVGSNKYLMKHIIIDFGIIGVSPVSSGFWNIGKIPELRNRILYTAALLGVYRIGIFVSTPGVDRFELGKAFKQLSGTLFGLTFFCRCVF